jgi:hypothetical protein
VWYHEVVFIRDPVAVQDQVEIQSPRRSRVRSFTAEPSFDVEERLKEVAGGQAREACRGGIQKSRLLADTNGIGFVKSRYPELLQVLREGGDGFTEQTLAVTQIAAEGYRYRDHW